MKEIINTIIYINISIFIFYLFINFVLSFDGDCNRCFERKRILENLYLIIAFFVNAGLILFMP